MKKSIKKLNAKTIKNIKAVKGGNKGAGADHVGAFNWMVEVDG